MNIASITTDNIAISCNDSTSGFAMLECVSSPAPVSKHSRALGPILCDSPFAFVGVWGGGMWSNATHKSCWKCTVLCVGRMNILNRLLRRQTLPFFDLGHGPSIICARSQAGRELVTSNELKPCTDRSESTNNYQLLHNTRDNVISVLSNTQSSHIMTTHNRYNDLV